jgi:hypothetical protein
MKCQIFFFIVTEYDIFAGSKFHICANSVPSVIKTHMSCERMCVCVCVSVFVYVV